MAEPIVSKPDAGPLRLANFIRANIGSIVEEWVRFAQTRTPAGENMTHLALQDHIVARRSSPMISNFPKPRMSRFKNLVAWVTPKAHLLRVRRRSMPRSVYPTASTSTRWSPNIVPCERA